MSLPQASSRTRLQGLKLKLLLGLSAVLSTALLFSGLVQLWCHYRRNRSMKLDMDMASVLIHLATGTVGLLTSVPGGSCQAAKQCLILLLSMLSLVASVFLALKLGSQSTPVSTAEAATLVGTLMAALLLCMVAFGSIFMRLLIQHAQLHQQVQQPGMSLLHDYMHQQRQHQHQPMIDVLSCRFESPEHSGGLQTPLPPPPYCAVNPALPIKPPDYSQSCV